MAGFRAATSGLARDLMSDLVADIDQRLPVTYASLAVARRRFLRRPSAAHARACEVVEAQVNELLDLRLALTCAPG